MLLQTTSFDATDTNCVNRKRSARFLTASLLIWAVKLKKDVFKEVRMWIVQTNIQTPRAETWAPAGFKGPNRKIHKNTSGCFCFPENSSEIKLLTAKQIKVRAQEAAREERQQSQKQPEFIFILQTISKVSQDLNSLFYSVCRKSWDTGN